MIIYWIAKSADYIAEICKGIIGNALTVVFAGFSLVQLLEMAVEIIFWGKPFAHLGDVFVAAVFILYGCCVVYACNVYKYKNNR